MMKTSGMETWDIRILKKEETREHFKRKVEKYLNKEADHYQIDKNKKKAINHTAKETVRESNTKLKL